MRARRNGRSGVLGAGASEREQPIMSDGPLDAPVESALDAWRPGSCCLSHDLRVAYANARWARMARRADPARAPLATLVDLSAGESLVELRATLADGETRERCTSRSGPRARTPRRDSSRARCGASAAGTRARGARRDGRRSLPAPRRGATTGRSRPTWPRCSARCATSRRGSATALAPRCCE